MKNAMYITGIVATANDEDALSCSMVALGGLFPNESVIGPADAPCAVIAQHAPKPSTMMKITKIIASGPFISSLSVPVLQTGCNPHTLL